MRIRSAFALLVVLALAATAAACSGTSTSATSVTSVSVNGTAPAVGAASQFTATAVLAGGTTQDVTSLATWSSSNPSAASVSPTGVVTGVDTGAAVITATYSNVIGSDAISVP